MQWGAFGAFLVFVAVLAVLPGPDTAVAVKNALTGGFGSGIWCVAGIALGSLVQGGAAAAGLSVVIVTIEPLFLTVKWVGAAYLMYLAIGAFLSARRANYDAVTSGTPGSAQAMRSFRQGLLSNITNPRVIAFYLAVLPQFMGTDASPAAVALYALGMPVIGSLYLLVVVAAVDRARTVFSRTSYRRSMDIVTGTALVGFGTALALE